MTRKYDIACLGDTMIECIVPLAALPQANMPLVLDAGRQQFGGSAYNLCWYLSQLNHSARLIGPYGLHNQPLVNDALLTVRLSNSGLIPLEDDTDFLIVMGMEDRQYTLYLRASLSDAVATQMVSHCKDIPFVVMTGSRHPHIRQAQVSLSAQRAGSSFAFTPSYPIYEYHTDELKVLLQRAHVTILNEQEAAYVVATLGMNSEQTLANYVPRCLLITRAAKGAELYEHGIRSTIRSYSNHGKDVIGAGDAFLAGFLHCFLAGVHPRKAAEFGAALAACGVDAQQIRVKVTEAEIDRKLSAPPRS